jgi:ABC-type spermidine/putrescine transport system permease subunit I
MLSLYKFELNFSGTIVIFVLSCAYLRTFTDIIFPRSYGALIAGSLVALIIYLLFEAYATGKVLANVRKQLLQGTRDPKVP